MTPTKAFHALALAATARAAAGAARTIGDRRAGRDATEQEPEGIVRHDLGDLRADLGDHVLRLRLRAIAGTPDDATAALAQTFETRVLLDDTARALARVHQKLLSLYPAVPDETVEGVRVAAAALGRRVTADEPDRDLGAVAVRLADLVDHLAAHR